MEKLEHSKGMTNFLSKLFTPRTKPLSLNSSEKSVSGSRDFWIRKEKSKNKWIFRWNLSGEKRIRKKPKKGNIKGKLKNIIRSNNKKFIFYIFYFKDWN